MTNKIEVVYDKQCPACSIYCELLQSGASDSYQYVLADAREDSEAMREITRRGLDIDEGMVVVKDGELYYGADAIQILAEQGPRQGIFNRLNRLLFGQIWMAHRLYPMLRSLRNLLLRVLGVRRINNLRVPDRDQF